MDFEKLTADLNIDKSKLKPYFEGEYNQEVFINASKSLAQNLTSYDNSKMAGRMLIYDLARLSKNNIHSYVRILKHRLSSKVIKYMLDNIDVLQKALDENIFYDYKDHDIFQLEH